MREKKSVIHNLSSILPLISVLNSKEDITLSLSEKNLLVSLKVLRNHFGFRYDILTCISGVDLFNQSFRFCVVYELLTGNILVDPDKDEQNDRNTYHINYCETVSNSRNEPKKYFELRKNVLRAVKVQAVKDVYDTYYNMLTEGLNKAGDRRLLSTPGGAILPSDGYIQGGFKPHISKQKVNEFALQAAKTLDDIAEKAVEMIIPADYRTIAENRQVMKTAGNLGIS
jgi:hypothetical protein